MRRGQCVFFIVLVILSRIAANSCQDFVFPASEGQLSSRINPEPEAPKTPEKCPENEAFFILENSRKYCDCRPGFLYVPPNDSCFKAYRQGPCSPGNYVILSEEAVKCTENPCEIDGKVPFNHTCHALGTSDACDDDHILQVNKRTFQLGCSNVIVQFAIVEPPQKECPLGSRRNTMGECKRIL